MSGERTLTAPMLALIGLLAAAVVGFTVLLLARAQHDQPLQTNAVSSASASLAASGAAAQ